MFREVEYVKPSLLKQMLPYRRKKGLVSLPFLDPQILVVCSSAEAVRGIMGVHNRLAFPAVVISCT